MTPSLRGGTIWLLQMQWISTSQICSHPWCLVHPGWNQEDFELDQEWQGYPCHLEGPIRGRTQNVVVHILSGSSMCKIEGVNVGGLTLARATLSLSTLLPSALGPLSTTPSMLTSERRYECHWLTSPPLTSSSLLLLPSLLPDLPSRLRLPPGSLSFNFLNGFEKGFRKSMSV